MLCTAAVALLIGSVSAAAPKPNIVCVPVQLLQQLLLVLLTPGVRLAAGQVVCHR